MSSIRAVIVAVAFLSLLSACASRAPRSGFPETAAMVGAEGSDEPVVQARSATHFVNTEPTLASRRFGRPTEIVDRGPMVLHFINVGQAAATLVEFPGNCGAILVDAGEGPGFDGALSAYLENFFEVTRPDLNRRIKALYITHPHMDHMAGLAGIGLGASPYEPIFEIGQLIDDGFSGAPEKEYERSQRLLGDWIGSSKRKHISFPTRPPAGGYSGPEVDPVTCAGARIRVLWGKSQNKVFSDHKNPNNHSLVVRIDYGESSVLITGDLMTPAIKKLLEAYADEPELLDVDLYVPGHHGADNGTTVPLLAALTPMVAVMQVGDLNINSGSQTAWGYGHPRLETVEALREVVSCEGRPAAFGLAAKKKPRGIDDIADLELPCHIYATGWNGNIDVSMPFQDGTIEVSLECELLAEDAATPGEIAALKRCLEPNL